MNHEHETDSTGKDLSDLMEERIWKKIGAELPASWSVDKKKGREKAFCCYNACARDARTSGCAIAIPKRIPANPNAFESV